MIKRFLLILISFIIFTIPSFSAETLHFQGFISDNANVISNDNINTLNKILLELQNKTRADLAVVTLKSLNGRPIEDVSIEIARKSGLGDKKFNNGALILVSPNDREARIEVGYGLEGYITDAKAGRILDNYMIPYFRDGNYEKGIISGTLALAYEIAEGYNVKLSFNKPAPPDKDIDISSIIIFIFILMILFSGNRPGGFFLGGSGFGSGSSGIRFGGGGGFGGGGASRRW